MSGFVKIGDKLLNVHVTEELSAGMISMRFHHFTQGHDLFSSSKIPSVNYQILPLRYNMPSWPCSFDKDSFDTYLSNPEPLRGGHTNHTITQPCHHYLKCLE